MRGPSAKPSVRSSTLCGSTPRDPHQRAQARAAACRAARAGRRRTSARFSPTSGTRSATVASATTSSSSSSSAGSRPAAREQRLRELEGDAGRAQLGRIAAHARVHDRAVRQHLARPVMVGHDDVHAERARVRDLLDGADPAVGRHQQARAALAQLVDRARAKGRSRRPCGSGSAAGPRRRAAQCADEHRGRADAVHVVVAVHGDPVPRRGVGEDRLDRLLDARRSASGRAPPRRRGSCAPRLAPRARAGRGLWRASCLRRAQRRAPERSRTRTGGPSSERSGSETPRDHRQPIRRKWVTKADAGGARHADGGGGIQNQQVRVRRWRDGAEGDLVAPCAGGAGG